MSKRKLFAVLAIVLLVAAFGITLFSMDRSEDEGNIAEKIMKTCPRYKIDVDFDPDSKRIVAHQELTIVNNKQNAFEELYFHLYPNAFKAPDEVPFTGEYMSLAYPEGFAPGYINIKKVTVGASEAKYRVDGTILEVKLAKALKPDAKLTLTIEFEVQIPPSRGNFGYGDVTFNMGNWYPVLAVYDENGWHKDPYYNIGDPFYSEVGLYEVNIRAPKDYTVAASGSLIEKREERGKVIWSFSTGLVRDFAWVASKEFESKEANVGKTKVTSYYIKGAEEYGQKALEYGKDAIAFFNQSFGEYPYEDYRIVASNFIFAGMEHPNIVMISDEFYGPGMYLEYLEYTVVHETAHQWWYGLVGNNQIEEAWLDEALTEYSTLLYFEHYYGKKVGQEVYEKFALTPYKYFEKTISLGPIGRHLSEFSGWDDYSATVYNRGAIMLKDLEARMGKVKLLEALKLYFRQHVYENASGEDFIRALNQVTGTDWSDYVYRWLKTTEILENAA